MDEINLQSLRLDADSLLTPTRGSRRSQESSSSQHLPPSLPPHSTETTQHSYICNLYHCHHYTHILISSTLYIYEFSVSEKTVCGNSFDVLLRLSSRTLPEVDSFVVKDKDRMDSVVVCL